MSPSPPAGPSPPTEAGPYSLRRRSQQSSSKKTKTKGGDSDTSSLTDLSESEGSAHEEDGSASDAHSDEYDEDDDPKKKRKKPKGRKSAKGRAQPSPPRPPPSRKRTASLSSQATAHPSPPVRNLQPHQHQPSGPFSQHQRQQQQQPQHPPPPAFLPQQLSHVPDPTPLLSQLLGSFRELVTGARLEAGRDESLQTRSQAEVEESIKRLPTPKHRSALCLTMNRYGAFCASPAIDVPVFPISGYKVAAFLCRASNTNVGASFRHLIPQPGTFPLPYAAGLDGTLMGKSEGSVVTRELVQSWIEALGYAQAATRVIWDSIPSDLSSRTPLLETPYITELLRVFDTLEQTQMAGFPGPMPSNGQYRAGPERAMTGDSDEPAKKKTKWVKGGRPVDAPKSKSTGSPEGLDPASPNAMTMSPPQMAGPLTPAHSNGSSTSNGSDPWQHNGAPPPPPHGPSPGFGFPPGQQPYPGMMMHPGPPPGAYKGGPPQLPPASAMEYGVDYRDYAYGPGPYQQIPSQYPPPHHQHSFGGPQPPSSYPYGVLFVGAPQPKVKKPKGSRRKSHRGATEAGGDISTAPSTTGAEGDEHAEDDRKEGKDGPEGEKDDVAVENGADGAGFDTADGSSALDDALAMPPPKIPIRGSSATAPGSPALATIDAPGAPPNRPSSAAGHAKKASAESKPQIVVPGPPPPQAGWNAQQYSGQGGPVPPPHSGYPGVTYATAPPGHSYYSPQSFPPGYNPNQPYWQPSLGPPPPSSYGPPPTSQPYARSPYSPSTHPFAPSPPGYGSHPGQSSPSPYQQHFANAAYPPPGPGATGSRSGLGIDTTLSLGGYSTGSGFSPGGMFSPSAYGGSWSYSYSPGGAGGTPSGMSAGEASPAVAVAATPAPR